MLSDLRLQIFRLKRVVDCAIDCRALTALSLQSALTKMRIDDHLLLLILGQRVHMTLLNKLLHLEPGHNSFASNGALDPGGRVDVSDVHRQTILCIGCRSVRLEQEIGLIHVARLVDAMRNGGSNDSVWLTSKATCLLESGPCRESALQNFDFVCIR